MLDMFMNEEVEQAVDDWIHRNYGKSSGLLKHEYKVIVDSRGDWELNIKAGKTVLIAIQFTPFEPQFKQILRYVFSEFPLRDFLRGSNIPRTGGAKWYEFSGNNMLEDVGKINMKVIPFEQKFVTSLELTDKKTKRKVKVEVVGSVFDAQQEAIRLLYGEKMS